MLECGALFQYIYSNEEHVQDFSFPHLHRGDFFSIRLHLFTAGFSIDSRWPFDDTAGTQT